MPAEVIEEALTVLCAKYIFPDKAARAADAIRVRRDAGEYRDLTEETLAERLTAQLFDVCADKHLQVRLRPPDLLTIPSKAELLARFREQSRLDNYGVAKVERLDGNIGYLDIRHIAEPNIGGGTIAAAMTLVAHTAALIIDLRNNTGGSPDGVIFWNSYLFPDHETHLNSIYDGASGTTRQYWSLAYLPGERYLDRPVYVLTSAVTFSGGEEFAYNLKAQDRATLIGQTTGGGAHPIEIVPLTPPLDIFVPVARSINPVTATNWEAAGVEPDVEVPAEDAFTVAYQLALRHALTTVSAPPTLAEIRAALAGGQPANVIPAS